MITAENVVLVNDANRWDYIQNHDYYNRVFAYLKGANGHYYLARTGWSNRIYMFRLQKRNQIRSSDNIGYIDYDLSEILDGDREVSKLSEELKQIFADKVNKHKPYRKKTRRRDSQRQKCYTWENKLRLDLPFSHKLRESLTKEEVLVAVKQILRLEGVSKEVKVRFRNNCGFSSALADRELMFSVINGFVCFQTVLHELAHIINHNRGAAEYEPGHGPAWVGLYMHFMFKYADVDMDDLKDRAAAERAKFNFKTVR